MRAPVALVRPPADPPAGPPAGPPYEPPDLVARLVEGERSALGCVYDRHHASVRTFARRLLGDDEAAEDLVHDVFLALPSAMRRYEGRAGLRSFLLGIAANLCHRHVRSAVRARAARARVAREPAPEEVAPGERRHREELARALQRGMDELPLEQRVCFTLHVVEERPSPEVAEILGIPEGTVRTRTMRARERLRLFLESEGVR